MLGNDQILKATCREWQRVLRLQDWDVHVRFASLKEMLKGSGASTISGLTDIRWGLKTAVVQVVREEDWDRDEAEPYDAELILLHELLHVHLWAWEPPNNENNTEYICLEQGIELIAKTLLEFKRGNVVFNAIVN